MSSNGKPIPGGAVDVDRRGTRRTSRTAPASDRAARARVCERLGGGVNGVVHLILLGSTTRGRIVASARVTCHRQIPVIQPAAAAQERLARPSPGVSFDADLLRSQ